MNRLPNLTAALLLTVSTAAFADGSLMNKAPAPTPIPTYTNTFGQSSVITSFGARAGENRMNERTDAGFEHPATEYVSFKTHAGRNVLSRTIFARIQTLVADRHYQVIGIKILGTNGLEFIPQAKLNAVEIIKPNDLLAAIAKAKGNGQFVDVSASTVENLLSSPKPAEQRLLVDVTNSVLDQNNASATTFVREANRFQAESNGLPEFRASLNRARATELVPRPSVETIVRESAPAASRE